MKKFPRGDFVSDSLKATALTAVGSSMILDSKTGFANNLLGAYQFAQIPLPYAYVALEPSIDAMTMDIHYHKPHAAYVKNVNDAIAAENIVYTTEKEFFANASKLSAKARNNSGGVWNHNFFWQVMKPNGGGAPSGSVAEAINGGL